MKIQKLTIHNIASIEDATIDFSTTPLSEAEVFLISGNTGSGKSTILDAICLALYDVTPRLDDTEMRGEYEIDGENVKIANVDQLLRRGAKEGSVHLIFETDGGERYEAIWKVIMRRGGRGRRRERELRRLDMEAPAISGLTSVKEALKKILPLDFNQFTRTSMLAQGGFSRFLKSGDGEKGEILENITKTEIYKKIGEQIAILSSRHKAAAMEAKEKAEGISLLSIKERLEIRRKIAHRNMQLAGARKALEYAKEKGECLTAISTKEKRIQEGERCLETLRGEFENCLGGLWAMKETMAAEEKRLKEAEEMLKCEEPRRLTLEKSDLLSAWLGELEGMRDNIRNEEKKITEGDNLFKSLEKSRDIVKTSADDALEADRQAGQIYKDAILKLESMNLDVLRERKKEVSMRLELIKNTTKAAEECGKSRLQLAESLRKAAETEREKEALKETIAKLAPVLENAENRYKEARRIYEGQKDTVAKLARAMRQSLQVGDDCPVCRQKVMRLPSVTEEELENLIKGYRKEYEDSEKDYDGKKNEIVREQTRLESLEQRLVGEMKAIEERQKDKREKKEAAIEASRRLGMEADNEEDMEKCLERLMEQELRKEKEIQEEIEKGEKQSREADRLRKVWDVERKKLEEATKVLRELEDKIKETKSGIEMSGSLIKNWQEGCKAKEKEIGESVEGEWKIDWKTEPELFRRELKTAADAYRDIRSSKENLERHIGMISTSIAAVEESRKVLTERMPEWAEATPVRNSSAQGVGERFVKLIGEVSACTESLRAARTEMKEKENQLYGLLGGCERPGEETVRIEIEHLRQREQGLLRKKTELSMSIENDRQRQKESVELKRKADELEKIYQKWYILQTHFGGNKGNDFRLIAQEYVLSNLVKAANHYMNSLSGRYTLSGIPGSLAISVKDAYQGGTSRSANTLSGGETFLVSLSLALALSDLGGRMKTDTLFIDEGFGSLSGIPLQNAIHTLRKLHGRTGRHVGIISHIEELRERIPVQIRVEQESESSASTVRVF